MIPIVSRKSSTGIPLSTWMFLKTSSARRGFSGDAFCTAPDAALIHPATAIPVAASTARPDRRFILCLLDVICGVPCCVPDRAVLATEGPDAQRTLTLYMG